MRSRLTAASSIAASEEAGLDQDRLAVARSARAPTSIGRWSTVAPMPRAEQHQHRDEARRWRSAARRRRARRRAAPPAGSRQRTSSPIRPPSQTEPETRCSQSSATASPRGDVWPAWPAAPGKHERPRPRRSERAGRARAAPRSSAARAPAGRPRSRSRRRRRRARSRARRST